MKEFASGSRTPSDYERAAIPKDAIQKGPRLWESRDKKWVWLDGVKIPVTPAWKTELDQRRRQLDALERG